MKGFRRMRNSLILILLSFSFLLSACSCSSVYKDPQETDGEQYSDMPEEYFTTGSVLCVSPTYGLIYEGQWIYVESQIYDTMSKNGTQIIQKTMQRLVKYNPVTDTVSSVCLNPTCMHSSEECLLCAPEVWLVSYFNIFDDWLLYSFSNPFAEEDDRLNKRTYLFNLKTGESRELHAKSEVGEMLISTYLSYEMHGKIYSSVYELDYTGEEEYKSMHPGMKFVPETRMFIDVYDPETDKTERLFEVDAEWSFEGMTNKRFFFKDDKGKFWTCDYNGDNITRESVVNFDFRLLSGQYAYPVANIDYTKTGYNLLGYDVTTGSMFTMDFGFQIRSALIDSGQLCITTLSNIDEFREFTNDRNAYAKKLYPEVTDPAELSELVSKLNCELQFKGTLQFYITDAVGENKKLVFEKDHVNFIPFRLSGNYLFGEIYYGDPATDYKTQLDNAGGKCVINFENGEITHIPQLEIHFAD